MNQREARESLGQLFILSAPAGTGKTTLVNRLKEESPRLKETISCTTRAPRKNEVDGVDYFFISRPEFEVALKEGAFLEWVELYHDYYGTLYTQVKALLESGYDVILVIDTQGALRLRESLQVILIFILPPSMEELRRRLENRGTESVEAVERRLALAKHEMKQAHLYDYNIINDNLEEAYTTLKKIVHREEG